MPPKDVSECMTGLADLLGFSRKESATVRWTGVTMASACLLWVAGAARDGQIRQSGRGRVPRQDLAFGLREVAAGGRPPPWMAASLSRLAKTWAEGNS